MSAAQSTQSNSKNDDTVVETSSNSHTEPSERKSRLILYRGRGFQRNRGCVLVDSNGEIVDPFKMAYEQLKTQYFKCKTQRQMEEQKTSKRKLTDADAEYEEIEDPPKVVSYLDAKKCITDLKQYFKQECANDFCLTSLEICCDFVHMKNNKSKTKTKIINEWLNESSKHNYGRTTNKVNSLNSIFKKLKIDDNTDNL